MAREDHQPNSNPVERPERSSEERAAVCGRVIAFITALSPLPDGSAPDIAQALTQAKRARVAAALVLAAPPLVEAAREAMRMEGGRGRTLVQAIEYDPAAAIPLTREAGDFELFNLPFGLLETTRVIADSLLDDYEGVLIMDAAQDKITADHVYELCQDLREHPDAEVIVSWIQWLRRTPCLLTPAFLARLEARDPNLCGGASGAAAGSTHAEGVGAIAAADGANSSALSSVAKAHMEGAAVGAGTATHGQGSEMVGAVTETSTPPNVRPVPRIRTFDHVFGEEQLAAPGSTPAAVQSFLGKCTMSALQAVQLAKYAADHPDEELHSPNQKLALMGPVKPEPLNNADALLVKTAGEVLRASEVDLAVTGGTGVAVGGADIAATGKAGESDFGMARSVSPQGGEGQVEKNAFGVGADWDAQASGSSDEQAELAWADVFGNRNKRDFPLLNDRKHAGRLVYLDSAATSQRVDVALQAQRDYDVHENANVYRGAYELSAQSTFTFNDARKRLEDFIGAERRSTVYTTNTTGATNLVALAWGERNIGEGDLIVCSLADHHSNALPFLMLAQRKGARIAYIPYDESGRLDQRAYTALLEERPKLVCIAQIGNVFGIEAPVKAMVAAAHDVGARVLVDAAQSFPHLRLNVDELGADWVAMSAHKAYGPMGIGALWISPAAFDEMDPLVGGGGTVSHVGEQSYYLRPKALQYEPGTPPVSQAVGWAAAIGYLDALGMDNVARHSAALTRYAVRGLQRIDGVNVLGDHTRPDGQNGLVSFTVRSVAPAATAAFLGGLDVAIRSGGHCALPLHASLGMIGTGRISIGVHTTRDDIDAALTAIALCREAYES